MPQSVLGIWLKLASTVGQRKKANKLSWKWHYLHNVRVIQWPKNIYLERQATKLLWHNPVYICHFTFPNKFDDHLRQNKQQQQGKQESTSSTVELRKRDQQSFHNAYLLTDILLIYNFALSQMDWALQAMFKMTKSWCKNAVKLT